MNEVSGIIEYLWFCCPVLEEETEDTTDEGGEG